jgi:hypothetical protein
VGPGSLPGCCRPARPGFHGHSRRAVAGRGFEQDANRARDQLKAFAAERNGASPS